MSLNIEKMYGLVLKSCNREIKDESGAISVSLGLEVLEKCFKKDADGKSLLDIDAPIPGQKSWTPLAMTVFLGKIEETKKLLDLGANPAIEIENKINPLHLAAANGALRLCHYFLKSGVNVDSLSSTKTTPMMRTCEGGHLDIAKLLLRNNADIELKDVNDKACVDYAVENSYQELATFLQYTSLKKTIDKEGVVNPSKGKKVSKV